MKQAALNEVSDALPAYLKMASDEGIVITRDGKPVGVLVGFDSEEDWLDYQVEHDPRFQQRVAQARESIQAGRVTKLEDISEPRPSTS